jgi:deoxyadenosine/deoxycytidine kinase
VTAVPKQPLIVELVGPAGVGKTTLVQTLQQRNRAIATSIPLREVEYLPFLLRDVWRFLPAYWRHYRHTRWFTWSETRSMIYLKAWHQALTRSGENRAPVILLDHGPIFRLAMLREFGPALISSTAYRQWWAEVLQQWAKTLDLIVWLDAPDETLLERIDKRQRWHAVKGQSAQVGHEFLRRYRGAYAHIITQMTTPERGQLLCLNTHQLQPTQLADAVLAACTAVEKIPA